MCAVEMVIPRFRSSGALSIAPYARKFASPFSACLFVIAAVNVVCNLSALDQHLGWSVFIYLAVIDVTNCTWNYQQMLE